MCWLPLKQSNRCCKKFWNFSNFSHIDNSSLAYKSMFSTTFSNITLLSQGCYRTHTTSRKFWDKTKRSKAGLICTLFPHSSSQAGSEESLLNYLVKKGEYKTGKLEITDLLQKHHFQTPDAALQTEYLNMFFFKWYWNLWWIRNIGLEMLRTKYWENLPRWNTHVWYSVVVYIRKWCLKFYS